MPNSRPLSLATRVIHAGQSPDPSTGAIVAPTLPCPDPFQHIVC